MCLATEYVTTTRKLSLASIVLLAVTLNFITARGIDYVSRPKLVSLDDVLNYNGKGYESGRRGRPARRHHHQSASSPSLLQQQVGVGMGVSKPISLEKEAQKREARKNSSVLPSLMSATQGPSAKQD